MKQFSRFFLVLALAAGVWAQSPPSGWWLNGNGAERVEIRSHSRGLSLALTYQGKAYNLAGRWLRYPDLFEFDLQGRVWTAQVLSNQSIGLTDPNGKKVTWQPMAEPFAQASRPPERTGLPAPARTGTMAEGNWSSSSGNKVRVVSRNGRVTVEVSYRDGRFERVPGRALSKSSFEYAAQDGRAHYQCLLESSDRIRCYKVETGTVTYWQRISGGLDG